MKALGRTLEAASLILSTLISERPWEREGKVVTELSVFGKRREKGLCANECRRKLARKLRSEDVLCWRDALQAKVVTVAR